MKTLCVFFVVAIFSSQALGFRLKRQAAQPQENLDDRYGWDRDPWQIPEFQRPNQFPENFPSQFPGGFPDQFPGLGQFPGQGQGQRPGQNQPQQSTTTASAPTSSTAANDAAEAARAACVRNCPVTSEYNPVCGSNNVDYDNPGRLECDKFCGVNVTLFRNSRCPAPTPAP